MDEARIAAHAVDHHGVFDHQFLRSIGVDDRQTRRFVRVGRWRQLHEGVFAASSTPDSFELRAEAALRAVPEAVHSVRSAAVVHGLAVREPCIEITAPPASIHRVDGVVIHRTMLPSHHVTQRKNWRITTLERTIIDLGRVLASAELQRLIEDAVVDRRTTLARVETTFGETASRGRAGIARARKVLGNLDNAPPTESELEARFWRLLTGARLPLPERQASFEWLNGGAGRVDFWYPAHRLIIELDGRRFHLRLADFESDRRRDQLALANGIATARFTHRQLATEAPHVLTILRQLLAG